MPLPEFYTHIPPHILARLRAMLEDGTTCRAAEQWLKAQGYPGSKSAVARWKTQGYPSKTPKPRKVPIQSELDL